MSNQCPVDDIDQGVWSAWAFLINLNVSTPYGTRSLSTDSVDMLREIQCAAGSLAHKGDPDAVRIKEAAE